MLNGLVSIWPNKFINYFKNQWVLTKNGWFEGFQLGISSQSNAFESAHRHDIKSFGNVQQRSATKRFMNGDGQRVVEEWSLERCDVFSNGNLNNNQKTYKTKPVIERRNWDDAWKWDAKKHQFSQVPNFVMSPKYFDVPFSFWPQKYF